jgi:1,4-alpha-glucan branching enzyme
MATEEYRVATYREFTDLVLPRIAKAGYNTVQLMAVQEHPYYGSFGYQVSNFFAPSSRFGTPEELMELVDTAHGLGLSVIMDLVHSHAVKNEIEGLGRIDGSYNLYFHEGDRGEHPAWNTRIFDYGKIETLHLLLSNCRYWLDVFKFDGFRFDGVTSMLYRDHGLGTAVSSYYDYFSNNVDDDAVAYLALANKLIHDLRPDAITIAEEVSAMPWGYRIIG